MNKFIKFFGVGVLNTAIDLVVLNALVYAFGAGENGKLYIFFKTISFLVAVTNSYFLNKFWVFSVRENRGAKEPALFLVVSIIGLVCNVSISYAVFGLLQSLNASLFVSTSAGALIGSVVVFAWNFIGYKFLVFKNKKQYV